jgi:hypothetical protein
LLEQSLALGPAASWMVCTNAVTLGGGELSVTIPNAAAASFYRLRKL